MYNVNDLTEPKHGDEVVLVIEGAYVKKAKTSNNVTLTLKAVVMEGQGLGMEIWHRIMLAAYDSPEDFENRIIDEQKTVGWRRRAVQDLTTILGYQPEALPQHPDDKTDYPDDFQRFQDALVGSAFRARLKLVPAQGQYQERWEIDRLLRAVDLQDLQFS